VLGELKTKRSRRRIHLTPRAAASLRAHRKRQLEERVRYAGLWEDHGLVFASHTGSLINPSNLRQRSFRPLLKRAGLPRIRFHDLRHTAATLLLKEGVHPQVRSGTPGPRQHLADDGHLQPRPARHGNPDRGGDGESAVLAGNCQKGAMRNLASL
jgi:integrase